MRNLINKIKKNTGHFCEWLIMDLAIAFLPIIIKFIFSSITGLVDIYIELFFVALLLSAGTLKYLYKLKKDEKVDDPFFWISVFILIIAAIAYGSVTVRLPGNVGTENVSINNGNNRVFATLLISDFSSVLISLVVWFKSVEP